MRKVKFSSYEAGEERFAKQTMERKSKWNVLLILNQITTKNEKVTLDFNKSHWRN